MIIYLYKTKGKVGFGGSEDMSKYKILMKYSDGENEEVDDIFDTEEAAEAYAHYLVSCTQEGAETLYLSNPGDYPLDDYEDPDFEIIKIDD